MAKLSPVLTLLGLLSLGACTSTPTYKAPEQGNPEYLKGVDTRSEELYVSANIPSDARDYRDVYIAPVNLSKMTIIQPEGASADDSWKLDDIEVANLQNAVNEEFTRTLSFDSAYNIVENPEEADISLHTTIIAIHPYVTRSEIEAGAQPGGAITISLSVRQANAGAVLIRAVDTKSSDNIWAFNNIEGSDPAVRLIFRSWGNSIRRGLLQVQGRGYDPLGPDLVLENQ